MQSTDFEMAPILYRYTGNYQTFIAPGTGWYKIECWGAQGCDGWSTLKVTCYGGYVSGVIRLAKGEALYIYCGDGGRISTRKNTWNGGGAGNIYVGGDGYQNNGSGGGATDVRLVPGLWNDTMSLRSRIIVAGAGGGGNGSGGGALPTEGSRAGGLIGDVGGAIVAYSKPKSRATGGTQVSGGLGDVTTGLNGLPGSFGLGGNVVQTNLGLGGGGGSGYYGGGSGGTQGDYVGAGAGGSSFISGHAGCDAINISGSHTGQPNHYSGKVFKETQMIDGNGYRWTIVKDSLLLMPRPTGGTYANGSGHVGSGYCKISKAA